MYSYLMFIGTLALFVGLGLALGALKYRTATHPGGGGIQPSEVETNLENAGLVYTQGLPA